MLSAIAVRPAIRFCGKKRRHHANPFRFVVKRLAIRMRPRCQSLLALDRGACLWEVHRAGLAVAERVDDEPHLAAHHQVGLALVAVVAEQRALPHRNHRGSQRRDAGARASHTKHDRRSSALLSPLAAPMDSCFRSGGGVA